MQRHVSRTAAQPENTTDFVIWWSTAMWALAAVYLLATFSIR